MMTNHFQTIFGFQLLHNFYSNGRCNDFSIFPLSDTTRVMNDHQVLFRNKDNYSRALILAHATNPADENKPASEIQLTVTRPLATGSSLLFGMKLSNPLFSNFTSEYPSKGKIFLFTNSGNPAVAELLRQEIFCCGSYLSHRIVSSLALTLILRNSEGYEIARKGFAAGSEGIDFRFDLLLPANDFYTVTEDVTNISYTYYSDQDLVNSGTFGIIRIINHASSPFLYDGKPSYNITFTATSRSWVYYVVAPGLSGTDIKDDLNIVDVPDTGITPITFSKTYPLPANDPTALLLHSDTTKVAKFASNQQLAMKQAARKRVELHKKTTVLINSMPNPDISNPGKEMFIYV